jgi:hypothetical protein
MKRDDYLIASALCLIGLLYYIPQTCPTFYFWDSAELAAAVAVKGIPHPPGFPLYLLLARLFSATMPSDIGRATSLFSSICASLAIGIFYLAIQKIIAPWGITPRLAKLMGIGGGIGLLCTYSLAAQATRAEVYSLNLFLFMLSLYFAGDLFNTEINQQIKRRSLFLALFFIGLGLANHHLTMLLVLPAIIYIAISDKSANRDILFNILALILPLTIYIYLILIARQYPELNWGNPANLGNLLHVITGKGFKTPLSAFNLRHLGENYGFDLMLLYKQIGPILALLAAAGLVELYRKNKKLMIFLMVCFLFNISSTIFSESYFYENLDLHGYLLISLACLLVFSVFGLIKTAIWISSKNREIIVAAIAIIAFTLPGYANFQRASLAGNYSAKQMATVLADECSSDALVVTSSYNTYFILKAVQGVYGYRTDLRVVNVYLFGQSWYREDLIRRYKLQQGGESVNGAGLFYRSLINLHKSNTEIYIEYDDQSTPLMNYLSPDGYFMKFTTQSVDWEKIDKEKIIKKDLDGIEKFIQPGMDYEQLKSMMLMADGRRKFYEALGQNGLARRYLDEIDRIASMVQ